MLECCEDGKLTVEKVIFILDYRCCPLLRFPVREASSRVC